ncbi:MAG: ligase-associated DNA damage response endonuclease PdeM [Pseudomonadota bacterium]|nr:ligase-associated DNA damage response endonuclease PdeM [Pseudomonadota bacterium]
MRVRVGEHEVELLHERAVYWPATGTLIVADLHWGKEETFQAFGIPVPNGILADDLARLERALLRTAATRLLVLGDLVHGAVSASTVDAIAAWRTRCAVPTLLVRGNHDRHVPVLPLSWDIDDHRGVLYEEGYAFTHEPAPVSGAYTWAGHIHPMASIRGRGDALRLPCFHLGPEVGVLPAFGTFTGGVSVRPNRGDRLFAIAGAAVVPLPP